MSNILPLLDTLNIGEIKGFNNSTIKTDRGEFIDFFTDSGTTSFGYSMNFSEGAPLHFPELINCNIRQAAAKAICDSCGLDYAYFCVSGTESVEAMIKFARRYWYEKGENRHKIYSHKGSFHGRTYGSMSLSFTKDYHREGFGPLVAGMEWFEDPADIDPNSAAVVVTPAFVYNDYRDFGRVWWEKLVDHCNRNGILLCLDEVQTYLRLGEIWGFQMYKDIIKPDMVAVAKGVAGGYPTGVTMVTKAIAQTIPKRSHFSTFGGNWRSCQGILATLAIGESMLPIISDKGQYIMNSLGEMGLKGIKGKGLMMRFDYPKDTEKFAERCLKEGLLLGLYAPDSPVKLTPPLTVSRKEIYKALGVIKKCL